VSLTLNTYSHVMPDLQAEAATQSTLRYGVAFRMAFRPGRVRRRVRQNRQIPKSFW
jgi:hypothetical protein